MFAAWRKEEREIESLRTLITDSPVFSKKLDTISTSIPFLFEALPSKFDESDYVVKLSSLASASGAILASIDISQPDSEGNVAVDINLSGDIHSLERFLKNAETSLPLFDFSATGFQSSEGGEQFSVRLQSYVLLKQKRENMPYEELKEKLDSALAVNMDALKDSQIEGFETSSLRSSSSSLPAADTVGREDPFTPL